jgi:hypothetical protein
MTFKQYYIASNGSVRGFHACLRAGVFSGEPLDSLAKVLCGIKTTAEVRALYNAWASQSGAICSV